LCGEIESFFHQIVPQDSLIRQSLDCMLIQFLLGLLKSRANLSNNPATVIAQIVSALKTMAQNLTYGAQVLHILNSDPIWAEFKDQNHDLFIMDTRKHDMITGRFAARLKSFGG
jgi:DnaJ homolog subfamily C member 13